MVGLQAFSTLPLRSLPSSDWVLLYPATSSTVSVSLHATLYHQQCSYFIQNLRFQLKPPLTQVGFRSNKRVFVKCSCFSSPTVSDVDTEFLFSFFKEIGLNEKETEVLLEKNPLVASTSLDSLRARILSLNSVGIDDVALCCLIAKCPSLLTSEEVSGFISFVVDDLEGKIETSQLKSLFSTMEPRFLVGFDQKVKLLQQRGVSGEMILHILNNVNLSKALCLKPIEEIDKIITFLTPYGGIDLIVKRPKILNYDLESQLIPRMGFLMKLSGGDYEGTGAVLRKLLQVLNYSVGHMENHAELLRSFVGLNDQEIFKIVLVFPSVFSASRERKLYPRIEFLMQCGLNSEEIFRFLTKAPLFLGLSFEDNIAHKLVFLVKIGYRFRTKDLAMAMGSVTRTSCGNLQKVVGLFLNYGFSCEDIVFMSKKQPQILQYSHSSLEKKMKYLIEDMGREIGELLVFPAFLGYKLDDRIKERYEFKRKILGEGMSINKLLTVSTEIFSRRRRKIEVNVLEE
ncbi:hypothetical protein UlMin_024239 [Ulmus minor]